MADLGQEIGWDDEIEDEGVDFEPLPEGIYEFEVKTMTRGRFPGSDKMCACNTAELELVILDHEGKERHVFDSLKLNSKMEWMLSQFFLCIGQKKKGKRCVLTGMQWSDPGGVWNLSLMNTRTKMEMQRKTTGSASILLRSRKRLRQVYSNGTETLSGRGKGIYF